MFLVLCSQRFFVLCPHHKMSQAIVKKQNVKVVVRIRPFSAEEQDRVRKVFSHISAKELIVKDRKYGFDAVINEHEDQTKVFEAVVEPSIEDVLSGYNCTVFAYGQTGSGKTFTMSGSNKSEDLLGCIPRAAKEIFCRLSDLEEHLEYSVTVSYLELYNEEIRDLLGDNEAMPPLNIFSNLRKKGSVVVENVKEVTVFGYNDVLKLLTIGGNRRQTAPTLLNHQSSRSHTIFTIIVNIRDKKEHICRMGKLNLVDLAGSENISKTGARDLRALESSNINRSLLTLGRVIHSITEKAQHIPYRESKLTRILQDSLGGKTKTCIIATVAPGWNFLEQTLSTLDYAFRARTITNCPERNQKTTKNQIIKDLNVQIEQLRKELNAARSGSGYFVNADNHSRLIDDLKTQEQDFKEKTAHIEELTANLNELITFKTIQSEKWDNLGHSFDETNKKIEKYRLEVQRQKTEAAQARFLTEKNTENSAQLHKVGENIIKSNLKLAQDQSLFIAKMSKLREVINDKFEGVGEVVGRVAKKVETNENIASQLALQLEDHAPQAEPATNSLTNCQSSLLRNLDTKCVLTTLPITNELNKANNLTLRLQSTINQTNTVKTTPKFEQIDQYCATKLDFNTPFDTPSFTEPTNRLDALEQALLQQKTQDEKLVKLFTKRLEKSQARYDLFLKQRSSLQSKFESLNLRSDLQNQLDYTQKGHEDLVHHLQEVEVSCKQQNQRWTELSEDVTQKAQSIFENDVSAMRRHLESAYSAIKRTHEKNLKEDTSSYNSFVSESVEKVRSLSDATSNLAEHSRKLSEEIRVNTNGAQQVGAKVAEVLSQEFSRIVKPVGSQGDTPGPCPIDFPVEIRRLDNLDELKGRLQRQLSAGELDISVFDADNN